MAYAVACSADGESHGRVAERLGVGQGTVSRWIRRRRRAKGSVRPVAIVPVTHVRATPAEPLISCATGTVHSHIGLPMSADLSEWDTHGSVLSQPSPLREDARTIR